MVAELEDDFHHFRTTIDHDGVVVTGIVGQAIRHPWTMCAAAPNHLTELIGVALTRSPGALAGRDDARSHCTHLFDLAGLAVAHAASGRATRTYDAAIPDRIDGRTVATLARDGESLLRWDLKWQQVVGPDPYSGRPLRGGFIAWALDALDDDEAEAAIVLRRAADISMGRFEDLDQYDNAVPLMSFMGGSCFTFTEARAEQAVRIKGSMRDFTSTPERLLDERSGEGP